MCAKSKCKLNLAVAALAASIGVGIKYRQHPIQACAPKWCRYVPLGLIWSPGKYPSTAAGFTDTFGQLHKWVLARLDWMEGQLASVIAVRLRFPNGFYATFRLWNLFLR